LFASQNTRKLHDDLRVHVLEQKAEIEALHKRDAESQKAISILETHLKNYEGKDSDLPQASQRILYLNKYCCLINLLLLSALQMNLPNAHPLTTSPRSSKC
jgi:hypothetical protein